MFKVVRDFVDKPMLMVYCDRSCDANAVGYVEPGTESQPETWKDFLSSLQQSGWSVAPYQQICPQHVAQDKANKSGIVIPTGVLVK